jgi:hypothetical protein
MKFPPICFSFRPCSLLLLYIPVKIAHACLPAMPLSAKCAYQDDRWDLTDQYGREGAIHGDLTTQQALFSFKASNYSKVVVFLPGILFMRVSAFFRSPFESSKLVAFLPGIFFIRASAFFAPSPPSVVRVSVRRRLISACRGE